MLENAGVIGGADMTPEAALAKLSYILAKEGLTTDLRKVLFFVFLIILHVFHKIIVCLFLHNF